jgi:GR25 family glycosyltransferase involved in LPS biosynthesis
VRTAAFVIHLARATARRAQVEALVAACPWPLQVFDAVDGQALTEAGLAQVLSDRPLMQPAFPFALGRGEIACFLSHRALWQRMLDEGLDQALILEDDVALGPGFAAALALAARFAGREGFVQFQTRPLRGPATVAAEAEGLRVLRPREVPRRTSAQLVGAEAARRLLAASARIDRPVDGMLQLVWATGQPVHCVVPSGVTDRTEAVGGSVAQPARRDRPGPLARLRRALARARYRAAVARLSAQAAAQALGDHCSQTKS